MMEFTKKYWKPICIILLIVCMLVWVFNYYNQKQIEAEKRLQQVVQLSDQQASNINSLQNELKISNQNAITLANEIKKAQNNQMQPVTNITVQSPTIEQAVNDVSDRIKKQDTSLPPVALEQTDRTVVAPQPNNEDFQVGIYKINNYKNWYTGMGFGVHGGDVYIPVSSQRNFSKDAAVEVQLNLDPQEEMKVKGGQVLYKRAMNKLFKWF